MPKIAELKLSSYGLEVADVRKNCDCGIAVAEQHFFKKLRNCDCGSASFKLRNCDCGLKKKLHLPTSAQLSVVVHNSAILWATKLITGSRTEYKEFFADFQKKIIRPL
jgi:hypothetical protein